MRIAEKAHEKARRKQRQRRRRPFKKRKKKPTFCSRHDGVRSTLYCVGHVTARERDKAHAGETERAV